MPVDFNNLVNDDGSNTVGTLLDKAELQLLLLQTVVSRTDTGTVNNWAPGLAGHTLIEWSGAADLAITGLAGGVAGQIVTFKNLSTKIATFAHNSGSSSAGNKFANVVEVGATPVAGPSGFISHMYDGTFWRLIAHEQGSWITPTYASGDWTASAGTWTVDAGDIASDGYYLRGRTLSWAIAVASTSVSATPGTLSRAAYGFTIARRTDGAVSQLVDNGGAATGGSWYVLGAGTDISFIKYNLAAFAASTNTTNIFASGTCEVS